MTTSCFNGSLTNLAQFNMILAPWYVFFCQQSVEYRSTQGDVRLVTKSLASEVIADYFCLVLGL